jgi:hypothetical protein
MTDAGALPWALKPAERVTAKFSVVSRQRVWVVLGPVLLVPPSLEGPVLGAVNEDPAAPLLDLLEDDAALCAAFADSYSERLS